MIRGSRATAGLGCRRGTIRSSAPRSEARQSPRIRRRPTGLCGPERTAERASPVRAAAARGERDDKAAIARFVRACSSRVCSPFVEPTWASTGTTVTGLTGRAETIVPPQRPSSSAAPALRGWTIAAGSNSRAGAAEAGGRSGAGAGRAGEPRRALLSGEAAPSTLDPAGGDCLGPAELCAGSARTCGTGESSAPVAISVATPEAGRSGAGRFAGASLGLDGTAFGSPAGWSAAAPPIDAPGTTSGGAGGIAITAIVGGSAAGRRVGSGSTAGSGGTAGAGGGIGAGRGFGVGSAAGSGTTSRGGRSPSGSTYPCGSAASRTPR